MTGRVVIVALAATLLCTTSPAAENEHRSHEHEHHALPPAAVGDDSIYQLESDWVNQNGALQNLNALAGKPVVASMIYTSCEYVCPLIVRDMLAIHSSLSPVERGAVAFVLFSFDPQRDTPQTMHRYATAKKLPASDWTLLAADDDASLELAVALGVRYKPLSDGEFLHSNLVFVLSCGGTPVFRQEGLGNAATDAVNAVRNALHNCEKA